MRIWMSWGLVMLALGACNGIPTEYYSTDDPDPSGDTGDSDSIEMDTGWDAPEYDPFAPQEDRSESLNNTTHDLKALLEYGSLHTACADYRETPHNRAHKLRCGKYMFFYETYGTAGVPKGLIDILLRSFEHELGRGFSTYGLIPDPYSDIGYPLGMALDAEEKSLAFTCASCHFGRLPDGRYSVGAANHDYDYGTHNLVLGVLPSAVTGELLQTVHPDAKAKIQPVLDAYQADWGAQLQLLGWMTTMLGQEIPHFPETSQQKYAKWLPGTMDFFINPLPIDDEVHTVSKISSLWGIPTYDEEVEVGMDHAMLGHTGNTRALTNFAELFVVLGGGDAHLWGKEELEPLVAYIQSLTPPPGPIVDSAAAERGRRVFWESGCGECHQGPRGSGLTLYDFEEVGTDSTLKHWLDPELDGKPTEGVSLGPDQLTHQIKSPRLVGLWAMKRFLHNGSVQSLEELFCVDGPRPPPLDDGMGNQGHTYGCESLASDEKHVLIAFLNSH